MLSAGTELRLAFWMASYSVGLPAGSPPPVRAATSMFFTRRAKSLPRLASSAAFLCLVVAHLEWPAMMLLQLLAGRPQLGRGQARDAVTADGTRRGGCCRGAGVAPGPARAPPILPAAARHRRGAARLVDVEPRAVPAAGEAAGELREHRRVDDDAARDRGVQLVQRPPAHLVDDLLLQGRPPADVEVGLVDPGEEELLVLAAGDVGEVEDGAAREHRPLQLVRHHPQAGLLLQLADRAVARVLPRVQATAHGEPPRARGVDGVVPPQEEDAVGAVEEDHPGGAAEGQAVRPGPPLRAQAVPEHPVGKTRLGVAATSHAPPAGAGRAPRRR